ncbi:MAG: hypothetical protein CMP47_03495 [Rickettsiales bacterium]|jgi:hypothetical protein|nr:hypothetical protein [Rickettsiales bacterium]
MLCLLLLITSFFLVSACTTVQSDDAPEPETKVFVDDNNVLHYDGGINKDANQRTFELYKSLPNKPTKLNITSKGGDVMEVLGSATGSLITSLTLL